MICDAILHSSFSLLCSSLSPAAEQELAQKAKQKSARTVLQKSKAFIEEQVGKVVLPAGLEQFATFMASVHYAEAAGLSLNSQSGFSSALPGK
ncbi:MAG TPA: hypothetical protein PLX23_04140 [Candidatus Hydrogenedens sp.]|nr:hypothetical protein [Candidatus Hydrogenedens sp.]